MVSIYSDGAFGRAILKIHEHFLRFSWPIDPYLAYFRRLMSPALDFPRDLDINDEITRNDVVAECGCNLGEISKQLGMRAREVHSFEPSQKAFHYLVKNTAKFPNIHCHNIGVSDKDETLPFNTEYSFSGISSTYILKDDKGQPAKYSFRTTANFMSIDSAAKKFNFHPTILLLDCEGSETDALMGMKESVKYIRSIFCETHTTFEEGNTAPLVRKLLRENGFKTSQSQDRGNSLWIIGRK